MKVNIHPGGNSVFPFVNWTNGRCYLNVQLRDRTIDYVLEWPNHEESGEFPVEDFDRLVNLMTAFRAAGLLFSGEGGE